MITHMLQETPLETAAGFLGRRCVKDNLEKTLLIIQCSNFKHNQNVLHWNYLKHLRFHVLWNLEKVLFQISKKKKQSCKENVWATPAKSGIWQNRDWSLVAISPFYRFLYRGGVILSQIFPQGGPTTAYDLGPTPKSSSKAYQSVFLSTAVLCSFTSANPSWCWEGQKPHWSFN